MAKQGGAGSVEAPARDRRLDNLITPWQPGQSGNPGGKSKTEAEIAALARSHAPEMVGLLMEIARNKRQAGTARVMAISELFIRGFGKAPQRVILEADAAGMDNPALQAFVQQALLEAARTIEGDAEHVTGASHEPA